MINNIEDAEKIVEQFEELQRIATPVAQALASIQNIPGADEIISDDITIDCGYLEATWETYFCGGSDSHSLQIPLKYLFDDDWLKEAKAEKLRKNLEAVAKKKEADAKKERIAKAQRYEQYLDLIKEFDDEKE